MNILLPVSRGGMFGLALDLAIDTAKAHSGKIQVLFAVDDSEVGLSITGRLLEEGRRHLFIYM